MVDAGLLIAFEGVDGCGKSTQVARAARWVEQRQPGRAVHVLREPGGTPVGEAVRALLLSDQERTSLSETLLYMSARAELYGSIVLPALARGEIVLLDRSHYSTEAYQGSGLGVAAGLIQDLVAAVTRGRLPDRVLLFDLPYEVAAARRGRRGAADGIEGRDRPYWTRVLSGYRALAARESSRFRLIDADRPVEAVASSVQESLADVV